MKTSREPWNDYKIERKPLFWKDYALPSKRQLVLYLPWYLVFLLLVVIYRLSNGLQDTFNILDVVTIFVCILLSLLIGIVAGTFEWAAHKYLFNKPKERKI